MSLTFEQFQRSRRFVENLGEVIADARWEDAPAPGYLYLDALYIEVVGEHWPIEARSAGQFTYCCTATSGSATI